MQNDNQKPINNQTSQTTLQLESKQVQEKQSNAVFINGMGWVKPTGRVINMGGGWGAMPEYTSVNSVQCSVCGTWTEEKVCLQCGACVTCGE